MELSLYLFLTGIEINITPSYTSELNGIAERINQNVIKSARHFLVHGNMDRILWAEAVLDTVHVHNRMIFTHFY